MVTFEWLSIQGQGRMYKMLKTIIYSLMFTTLDLTVPIYKHGKHLLYASLTPY